MVYGGNIGYRDSETPIDDDGKGVILLDHELKNNNAAGADNIYELHISSAQFIKRKISRSALFTV